MKEDGYMKYLIIENPQLANQWDFAKNDQIDINKITVASKEKVWWIGGCGHEWQASVVSRNSGRGCPYCSGQKVLKGFNDFGSNRPDLIEEWDYEQNIDISPYDVTLNSHKKVVWKCKKCKKTWTAIIKARVNGNGCPFCAVETRKNTFNKTIIKTRKNSVKDNSPNLVEEWLYDDKTGYTPENTAINSHRLISWKCKKCGYVWKAIVKNRVNGSGCPFCAGRLVHSGINDLKTLSPELIEEWDYERNIDVSPSTIHSKSGRKVWWKCKLGHEWECRVADRVEKNVKCPICSRFFKTSFAEQSVFFYVCKYFPGSINSYKPEFLIPQEIDIFIPGLNVGIEYDGQNYHNKIEKDIKKDEICIKQGITLIRIREPKCKTIARKHPTILLKDLSYEELSQAIKTILLYLNVKSVDIDVNRDKYEILKCFYNYAVNNSVAMVYPELCKEWDLDANKGLTPNCIPANKSKMKYNWICNKCGNKWQAMLSERIKGTGCPVCTNRRIVVGVNDLATTNLELAKEWDYKKNYPLKPQNFTSGSNENVWWICSKCGHHWHTRINRRVNGSGCSRCVVDARKKKVYQYSLGKELINIYDGLLYAAKKNKISAGAISKACKSQNHKACGYLWFYEKQ